MSPSTSCTPSDRKPHDRITSLTPCERSQSSMNVRKGRPASGITGLGTVRVSGRRRVPSPPASTSACMGSAADALVAEARLLQRLAVEEVAPVDDERHPHPVTQGRPVQLAELVPLGYQHDAVDAL